MNKRHWAILLIATVTAFVIASVFPVFLVVRGSSMVPTFQPGDRVRISKVRYGLPVAFGKRLLLRWRSPTRGEIVVFSDPVEGTLTMKRCLGVPGDTIVISESELRIDGRSMPISPSQMSFYARYRTVPQGAIFVAGDNPGYSLDSRHYGFVPMNSVLAKVIGGPDA